MTFTFFLLTSKKPPKLGGFLLSHLIKVLNLFDVKILRLRVAEHHG
jgi:hypothetical protein